MEAEFLGPSRDPSSLWPHEKHVGILYGPWDRQIELFRSQIWVFMISMIPKKRDPTMDHDVGLESPLNNDKFGPNW